MMSFLGSYKTEIGDSRQETKIKITVIQNEVESPGWPRKNNVEFPVLEPEASFCVFGLRISKGSQFCGISRGWAFCLECKVKKWKIFVKIY